MALATSSAVRGDVISVCIAWRSAHRVLSAW